MAKYKVTFIEDSGTPHTIDLAEGWSLMEGAVKHLVPGIDADCGGACASNECAFTCKIKHLAVPHVRLIQLVKAEIHID